MMALRPRGTAVTDHLPCHARSAALRGIEAAGCRVASLPPYRTPVELAFAKREAARPTGDTPAARYERSETARTPDTAQGSHSAAARRARPWSGSAFRHSS